LALDAFDIVTGAFGFTGRYLTRLLLSRGRRVRTLTGHPNRRNPFGESVEAVPFNFDRPDDLARSLEGAETLFNTYWVRFDYGASTYERAVENSRILIRAAAQAGVRRFVHVSISNPSEDSPFHYFRGKALVERALRESGVSYAILRPTVIFGLEDILINNIAWMLRKFPVFAIPGSGDYRMQPIFVEDMAAMMLERAAAQDNTISDAVGPEALTFNELVAMLARAVNSNARIIHCPPAVALGLSRVIGWFVGDVTLTRDEVYGLMANLLVSREPPAGHTRLSDWVKENAHQIGVAYASEVARHYR
jgi:uncharacterized protein YbjT (DUF2867 family)